MPPSSATAVDHSRFQEAQQAYENGEYRIAAKGFLASASRGPEGNGAAYHMAGNALMRLRRHQDAITVYAHALRDPVYNRRGSVWANMGAAQVEIGDYSEAFRAYENAMEEPDFTTPYKAFQGMAGALLERGRVEEAAIAYRKAALDPVNPDPGKALVNLGLCFMALGRTADAIEAYRAALGFDQYHGRGKALANLGQAYVALGEYQEAAKSFEKSTQLHGHKLSPAASAAYATALEVLGKSLLAAEELPESIGATGSLLPVGADDLGVEAYAVEADAASAVHAPSGMTDMAAEVAAAAAGVTAEEEDAVARADEQVTQPLAPFDHDGPVREVKFGDEKSVADFFSVTEEELKARGREISRAERHARGPSGVWRTVAVALIGVVVVFGALVVAYQAGYGWPTQHQTVGGVMAAYQAGTAVNDFWVAAPARDISKEMAKIPPVKGYTIDNVAQGATTSVVSITVTPKTGAALHYNITLSREGVGWKVIGIDNDWRTTGG